MNIWDDFENMLKGFDYTYMMSDDYRVWKEGCLQEDAMRIKIRQMVLIDKNKVKELILKHKSRYGTQFINEISCSESSGDAVLEDSTSPKKAEPEAEKDLSNS